MSTINDPDVLLDSFSDAVYSKDIERYLELYDEHVLVFDVWQNWSYEGLAAWRKVVEGWFASLGADRDRVTFRDKQIQLAGEMGFITAIVRFAALSDTGEELRYLDNRFTLVIRRSGESWKIIHQHSSGPIDFNTMKLLLKKPVPPVN